MNNEKIAIVIYKEAGKDISLLLQSLGELHVPSGFFVDVLVIEQAKSIAAAYNEAIRISDAKYKIYVRSNVQILDEDILCKLVAGFETDHKMGILGIVGTLTIPTSGVCQLGRQRVGKVYNQAKNDIVFFGKKHTTEMYIAQVKAVDGLLLATQYDIPWREDLFHTDSFYDTAFCIDMQQQGYSCGVLDCPQAVCSITDYPGSYSLAEKEVFLTNYSLSIYPKVLIIITTYNRPQYLLEALESAQQQTYKNLEIVISDDSTNDETKRVVQKYLQQDDRIKYFKHEKFSGMNNYLWVIDYIKKSSVEYVNWLMDDDKLYPQKIERMMAYYLEYDNVSLVTSYRHIINEKSEICLDLPSTKRQADKDTIFAGQSVGKVMLQQNVNFIGEFSTTLLKKSYLREDMLWGWRDALDWGLGMPDLSTWLSLMEQGDLAYIAEPLSAFRIHSGSAQMTSLTGIIAHTHWLNEIKYAYQKRMFLTSEKEYRLAVAKWLRVFGQQLKNTIDRPLDDRDTDTELWQGIELFEEDMLRFINRFVTYGDSEKKQVQIMLGDKFSHWLKLYHQAREE